MRTFPDALRFAVSATVSMSLRRRFLSCLWELTYRCNARCDICGYWRNPTDPGQELSVEDIIRALARLRRSGCRMINFTGGEPTLRSDLEEIVGAASRMGFWTSVVTNGGTLTRRRIRELKRAGLDNLFVSLDSPDPGPHDAHRGIPGLHRRVRDSLSWLGEDFLTGHRTGGVFCVLTAQNLEDMPKMLRLAEEAGVFAVIQPYHSAKTGDPAPSPPANGNLRGLLGGLRSRHSSLLSTQRYLDGVCDFLGHRPLPSCNAGSKYFSIDPFGYLHACVDQPAVGHILQDDLSVLRRPAVSHAVSTCAGCWYCFRGEADTILTLPGYMERAATICRALGTNLLRHWSRRAYRRKRSHRRAPGASSDRWR